MHGKRLRKPPGPPVYNMPYEWSMLLPRVFRADHESVRIIAGWLINGAFRWEWATAAISNATVASGIQSMTPA